MTPLDVDASCREANVTLAQLRAALPADVLVVSPTRAWLGFARAWGMIAIGEVTLATVHVELAVAALWQVPALIAGWLLVTTGMAGLFILGHDCGHEAFSRRRAVNTLVGHLCMSPILTGFHGWRLAHAHHHARAQLRGDDTDWPERMLARAEFEQASRRVRLATRAGYGSPVGLLVGFFVGVVRRTAMERLFPQVKLGARARRDLRVSNLAMAFATGSIVAFLFVTLGFAGVMKHYAIPLYMGMVVGALFTYLHHSGEGALVFDATSWTPVRGQVVSTFDVRFARSFEALFFHINRHPPHHLSPRIPWYNLPRAMDALRAAYPTLHIERRFSWRYLVRAWRVPLLAEASPGVFIAAPVDEA